MQAEELLCWSGMTDTEHTTSGSYEDDQRIINIEESIQFTIEKETNNFLDFFDKCEKYLLPVCTGYTETISRELFPNLMLKCALRH